MQCNSRTSTSTQRNNNFDNFSPHLSHMSNNYTAICVFCYINFICSVFALKFFNAFLGIIDYSQTQTSFLYARKNKLENAGAYKNIHTHMREQNIMQKGDFEVIAFLIVICIFMLVKLMTFVDFKGSFITLAMCFI